jgi:hsp70-interacting protein
MADGNNPWAWTGLLKWSLNHVDGTRDNADATPMSAEDKAFLEKVMREGIVDEGERMGFILKEATKAMEYYEKVAIDKDSAGEEPIGEAALEELLQELRDIVEQIDYARAFCSMQGLPFLLGCVQQPEVPESIRRVSLGIISTVGQNNPPVQQQLLEMGAIKTLSNVFFLESTSNITKAKIMQSIGSIVRNHELSENVFTALPQAADLLLHGLDPVSASVSLRSTTLFFLRALITSDQVTLERIRVFQNVVVLVADTYLEDSTPPELREMAIALLEKLLVDKKGGARILLTRKDALAARGIKWISSLRTVTGENRELAQTELDHWEHFLVLLSRAAPEVDEPPPLLTTS